MAAYAAVISLKNTINGLLNSCRIPIVPSTREILELAYNETTSLQRVLERFIDRSSSSERLDDLEGQIRDCAHELEDVLEFHESNPKDEEARRAIAFFVETTKEMEKCYIEELSTYNDESIVSSYIDLGVEMVGHSSQFNSIQKDLLRRMRPVDTVLFSFLGKDGSGRTLAAKTIFEDLSKGEKQFFDCGAWVTVGTRHQIKDVLICILIQIDTLAAGLSELLVSMEDEQLCNHLNKVLENRRCMIVLDDVRDLQIMEFLRSWIDYYQNNGSIIIVTTSFKEVSRGSTSPKTFEYALKVDMSLWFELRYFIFGKKLIPPELEEAGKKIAGNCPCSISAAKVLLFLLKSEKTVEEWSKIAADKENPIFMIADEISEISKIKTEMQFSNWDMSEYKRNQTLEWISDSVDLSGEIEEIKREMCPERFFSKMKMISLLGMAGIGKTTFARKLFDEFSISSNFDHYAWVNLGPKYEAEEILLDILAQIYPSFDKLENRGDEKLIEKLCVYLSNKRCFLVLDDLWSKEPLHHLINLFPDIKGKTLVTTRLAKVAKFGRDDSEFEIQLLDTEESWCLLCRKVFGGEGLCPPQLEKAGRKIAENCDGLPLLILTVAEQLLKLDMSEKCWNNVASGKEKSVFKKAHQQISKSLLPSYQRLPQHLKPCFLYVGTFLERYEIPITNFTNLCIAERFLEPNLPQIAEDFVAECLSELVDESLVMEQRKVSDLQIKTCRLHSVFWHLANSQARKNKFFHAMNGLYDDCSVESIESQRRLCIRNSVLLGMSDVQNSMESNTSAHSLICVGPLQHYPVIINFDMKLLRVMNALTIRLYEFPVEVVRLIHLRYLGLTCNGKLPTSISNLWKLEYLIMKRYMSINSSQSSSPLPMEIWDLKELKHLQVMGGRLPNPESGAALLKLSTLLDVSAQSCRKEVFKWIPNLKRLGIRIELMPDDDGKSFHYLNRICHLGKLESLKCVVVNPQIRPEVVPPPAPVLMFPPSLKRLSLSGLGYPWKYMSTIGKLENLEVLKLKRYAFQGPTWEIKNGEFKKLKFLLVEDSNLVHWKANSNIAVVLERLCIKHCYKLREFPVSLPFDYYTKLEIVDCSALTVDWVKQMVETVTISQPTVHLSWKAHTHRK